MSYKKNLSKAFLFSSVALISGALGYANTLDSNQNDLIAKEKSESTNNESTKITYSDKVSDVVYETKDEEFAKTLDNIGENGEENVPYKVSTQLPFTAETYTKSQKAPTAVTKSNWKNNRSEYYGSNKSPYQLDESGRLLLSGIYDELTDVVGTSLHLEGWATTINYTHMTGNNNATYIVMQNKANSNDVQIVKAKNKSSDLTRNWIWGRANTPSLRCTTQINLPLSWQVYGSSPSQRKGCYHDQKNIAFSLDINLETLFGNANANKQYNMYVVNSVGEGHIVWKELIANLTKNNKYSGASNSGDVIFDADDNNNKAKIKKDYDVYVRSSPYDSTGTNTTYTVKSGDTLYALSLRYGVTVAEIKSWNGLRSDTIRVGQSLIVKKSGNSNLTGQYFKKGEYTITNRRVVGGMTWLELSGHGLRGWITSNYVVDTGDAAVLRYNVTAQKLNVNYLSLENNAKVANSTSKTVNSNTSINITSKDNLSLSGYNNDTYARIYKPDSADIKRTFNPNSAPKDIDLFYDNEETYTVQYKDAKTGKILKSDKKVIEAGQKNTDTIKKGTVVGNVDGKPFRTTADYKFNKDFSYQRNGTSMGGVSLARHQTLNDTVTIPVETQEDVAIKIKHEGIDVNNNRVGTLYTDTVTVKLYPSQSTTFKVGAKGTTQSGAINNLDRTTTMVNGKWFFSGRGVDTSGAKYLDPKTDVDITKGYDSFTINGNSADLEMSFYYMKEVANPSDTTHDVINDAIAIDGQLNWFLTKPSNTTYAESYAEMNNHVDIKGKSFAIRNGASTIDVGGSNKAIVKDAAIHYDTDFISATKKPKFVGNGASNTTVNQVISENGTKVTPVKYDKFMDTYAETKLTPAQTRADKNKLVAQKYSLEYTNSYKDIYKPADNYSYGGHVFMYEYVSTEAVWGSKQKQVSTATRADHLLDHSIGETVELDLRTYTPNYVVGRKGSVTNVTTVATTTSGKTTERLRETSLVDKVTTDTQSKVGISGSLEYISQMNSANFAKGNSTSGFNNKFIYNKGAYNAYIVPDVDENFRTVENSSTDGIEKYNTTGMSTTTKNAVNNSNNKHQIGINAVGNYRVGSTTLEDVAINANNDYFVLNDTGMLIETKKTTEVDVMNEVKPKYQALYGDITTDKITSYATNKAKDSYYMPIDAKSSLRPNTEYTNSYVLSDVGLSELDVVIKDTFKFNSYLVGDVQDNVKFNTQQEPLINKGAGYSNKTVITPETKDELKEAVNNRSTKKSSSVRNAQTGKLWNSVKGILGW